jgi:hypothetical protein
MATKLTRYYSSLFNINNNKICCHIQGENSSFGKSVAITHSNAVLAVTLEEAKTLVRELTNIVTSLEEDK